MDWKIKMFDHKGVKFVKVVWNFQWLFYMIFYWSSIKYEVKRHNMDSFNQFMASRNLLYNFFNEFLMWVFVQDLVYLSLISKNPQHYKNSRFQWISLHKNLNRKIKINHFQIPIFDAKSGLQKYFFKNINY